MTKRARLRALVTLKQGLVVPGAYDGVSVRLVERAGYPVVYMTGYGTSASRLGLPDMAFAGLGEMVDHARNLAAAVGIPLIADADTGYGNALAVRRTVRLYESAGVAALHLEDQVAPKRCGHLTGHQVIALAEFEGKIRAAVEARTDPDLLIIARTDAISAAGFDEALRRGEAAARAGADVLFIEAPRTEEQIRCCRLADCARSATRSSSCRSTRCWPRPRRSTPTSANFGRPTTPAPSPTGPWPSPTSTS